MELNHKKDYMKLRREHMRRATPPPFTLITLNMKHLLEKNLKNRAPHLVY